MAVDYPDRLIWLYQFLEIFCDDCYGIGRLPLKPRVIDAGANIGMLSLFVNWVRPNADILAVEPNADNVSFLRRNTAGIGNIWIAPVALGVKEGESWLSDGPSDAMRTGLSTEGSKVRTIPLAALLDRPTHLLKMDIEGSEYSVLEACGMALGNVERLVIEVHRYDGQADHLLDIMHILKSSGLTLFNISGHRTFQDAGSSMLNHCCLLESWRG